MNLYALVISIIVTINAIPFIYKALWYLYCLYREMVSDIKHLIERNSQ